MKIFKKGDLLFAEDNWWRYLGPTADKQVCHVESILCPINTGSYFIWREDIQHHVRPTVSDPCDVMPGPRTL